MRHHAGICTSLFMLKHCGVNTLRHILQIRKWRQRQLMFIKPGRIAGHDTDCTLDPLFHLGMSVDTVLLSLLLEGCPWIG